MLNFWGGFLCCFGVGVLSIILLIIIAAYQNVCDDEKESDK